MKLLAFALGIWYDDSVFGCLFWHSDMELQDESSLLQAGDRDSDRPQELWVCCSQWGWEKDGGLWWSWCWDSPIACCRRCASCHLICAWNDLWLSGVHDALMVPKFIVCSGRMIYTPEVVDEHFCISLQLSINEQMVLNDSVFSKQCRQRETGWSLLPVGAYGWGCGKG